MNLAEADATKNKVLIAKIFFAGDPYAYPSNVFFSRALAIPMAKFHNAAWQPHLPQPAR